MDSLKLLLRYLSISLRAQAQYPASAIMLTVGQCAATAIEALSLWALFDRFGAVDGWRLGEIAVFYGLINISFSIADFLSRGFDVLGAEFLKTGNLDRLLLRPRTLTLQLIGHDFRVSRAGRLMQGFVVLLIGAASTDLAWTPLHLALATWTVAGGAALFFGLLVLQGALTFWTTESLEAMNVVTYGGVEAAQYPLSLYAEWFRNFLIFVVPLGCVAYYPVLALLGRSDSLGAPDWFLPAAPLAGFAFLAAAFVPWRLGVARYTSTGS
jgi:ABC-2 type transport system permease protein